MMLATLRLVLESIRPRQWIKNLIVFAPIAFAQRLLDHRMLLAAAGAFAAFCLASSAVYLMNDVMDREADSYHPEKKNRPIASGRLKPGTAWAFAAAVFACALALAALVRPLVALIVAGYVALNLAYSLRLKELVIIDAFAIAIGFVLRILAGAEVLRGLDPNIVVSTWILLCTLLGSLFLAFCKRRHELGLAEAALNHRASLGKYSTSFLDLMIAICTASTVMAYALWTMWPDTVSKYGTHALFWTVPFVCYGIFRYLYLVHQKNMGGSPSRVFLSDAPLIVNILLWFGAVVVILYGGMLGE